MTPAGPLASTLVCGGCGEAADPAEPYPFRCRRAGDGGDHVLRRVLDVGSVTWPGDDDEPNPFLRFRRLLHPYHVAVAGGMADGAFVDLVQELDAAVAAVDGHGFRVTPFAAQPGLAGAIGLPGPLLVKDETGNVSGSHKARHLFGLLLHLEVVERLRLGPPAGELAIASCGNAALAAAVVAAAGRRPLRVLVPTDAEPTVVERLHALGAVVEPCPRQEGAAGDPTYLLLQQAVAAGAVPFTCQGNENGLSVEGGMTLAYEMVAQLAPGQPFDHLFVQVGGGALASALYEGLADAVELGALTQLPHVHTTQTEGAWPLARAYWRVREREPAILEEIAAKRSEYMWPWETAPHSVAHGILDDETYDWLAVVEAMLRTAGAAVVVGEDDLVEANRLAVEETGIDVDETGSAGLAGLARLGRDGTVGAGETAAVLFTGARRRPPMAS